MESRPSRCSFCRFVLSCGQSKESNILQVELLNGNVNETSELLVRSFRPKLETRSPPTDADGRGSRGRDEEACMEKKREFSAL